MAKILTLRLKKKKARIAVLVISGQYYTEGPSQCKKTRKKIKA